MKTENFSLFLLVNIIFCKKVKAYQAVRLGLAWLDIFKPPKSRLELGLASLEASQAKPAWACAES
jgi:hypothetical protein